MKTWKFLLLLSLLHGPSILGCKKDKCDGVDSYNNGYCVDGCKIIDNDINTF